MRYQAVVFDLDGTLLDSLNDLANSMNAVLSQNGFATHDVPTYNQMVGDGVRMLVTRALPELHRNDETVETLVSEMREEYGHRRLENTRPYPQIPQLLDALAARHIRMAILSNKPHEATRAVVAALLPAWRFDAVQGESPETPRKPDPTGALRIASRLDIPPEQFLYLGDTDTDMKTANSAGMFAVGVLWGFRGREELMAHGARLLIDAPLQLLECFGPLPATA
ncbi:MAG: HAD family hydrolase [Syntrophobacteraceae bacterium]